MNGPPAFCFGTTARLGRELQTSARRHVEARAIDHDERDRRARRNVSRPETGGRITSVDKERS